MKGLLVVVSGPSGVGKSTVLKSLAAKNKNIRFSISVTTRPMRDGEKFGIDYHFHTFDEFKEMLHRGDFLETAEVYGNYYGTLKSDVMKMINAGNDVILEIDTVGALNVAKQYPEALLIYILPPSIEELVQRLTNRKTETEEQIATRLNAADKELKSIKYYGYVVKNEDEEETASIINEIIHAAHYTVKRSGELIKQFVGE